MLFVSLLVPITLFAQSSGGSVEPGLVPCAGADCTFDDLLKLVNKVIDFLIRIAIPIAMILFAYAGFLYVTAAGNTSQINKAHNVFKDVFIGFLIVLSAWLIVNTIVEPLISDDFSTLLEETK